MTKGDAPLGGFRSPLDGFRSPFGVSGGAGVVAPPSFTSQTVYEGQTLLGIDLASFFTNGADGWAVQSGSLPTGVTISSGELTGTFTAAGSFSAVIRGTNSGDASTQDNTFAFTVAEWYTGASVAWSPDSADVTSGSVTTFDDLIADAETLTYRATGAGTAAKATISSGVVSFTEAAEAAYVSATGASQLGSGNAFGHVFSGFTTSSSSGNGIPILRGTSTVSLHYTRFDLDASALQVDPLLRNSATLVIGRNSNEIDVLLQNDELHVSQFIDGDEILSFYQGLPINYDRRNTTGAVLAGTISDNLTAIIGHADTTTGRAFTGEFYGAAELRNGDSPTAAEFARVAGAIGGLSGNFTAMQGFVVLGVGNSLGAGSSPPAANPETVSPTRGFSVLDLSTDDTQYFTYDLRAPISHFRAPNWTNSGGDYARGAYVYESSSVYYCLADHTPGTFATDLSNNLWIAAAGREANLSGWTNPGLKGADPASSSDGDNNIARADPQVYMLNQIVTDSDAFVIYAGAHASGACLAAETADDNGGIDYWLSASDAPGTPTQTSLWDAHIGKLQKVLEIADATPAMHTPFKVLTVGNLGIQDARGGSNYAGGSNIISTAEYQAYLEAFISRAFSALGVDMILWQPASVDLDYVDNADYGIFAQFRAIETAVAAAEPRFVLGCPGHIDPGVNPDFTVDGNGAWSASVPSGGTQIHIGTPGTGDQLHWGAAYHKAQGRYDAGLVLAEYRRQRHGA